MITELHDQLPAISLTSESIISVPLTPTGFRSTNQIPISLLAKNVTFVWDTPAPSGRAVQYYELTLSPEPLTPTNDIRASTFEVSLTSYTTHTASLTAVNCAGRSLPITIKVGKSTMDCMS